MPVPLVVPDASVILKWVLPPDVARFTHTGAACSLYPFRVLIPHLALEGFAGDVAGELVVEHYGPNALELSAHPLVGPGDELLGRR